MKLSPKRLKEVRRFAAETISGLAHRNDTVFNYCFGVAQNTGRTPSDDDDEREAKAIRAELRRLAAELRSGGKRK